MGFYERCKNNVPLSTLSTFGIGGPARWLFRAKTKEDLQEAFLFVSHENCPFIVLGRGSNCLFSDKGFSGIVIQNRVETFSPSSEGIFEVGGGYSFVALGMKTANDGWSGLEYAVGIPGSVGGAVFMNAGAHKQQAADSVAWVDYLDESGNCVRMQREELMFGYRSSSFQEKKGIIVSVGFSLKKDDGASARQQLIIEQRHKTQPYTERSAGCVFRNPPGSFAGQLIEEAGLKGKRIGGAEVSTIHANFIVNKGGATAQDVLDLVNYIREVIFNTKGVLLQSEIRCIPSTFT